ncbi:MAG: hypothetical protein KC620_06205 [Myxococcales bacterium]|nr:hypothetical protein [Myxococcales bacterium]
MRRALLLTLFLAAVPSMAQARKGPFGLGVMLGEPSGLSAKYFFDKSSAVDFGLGYSFWHESFHFHADYLFHFPQWMARVPGGEWLPYVGIGGKLTVWQHHHHYKDDHYDDDTHAALGVRIPLGVDWHPRAAPIGVFLEVVPGVRLLPDTDPDLDLALGIRYYF